jgi:hypothetical protein
MFALRHQVKRTGLSRGIRIRRSPEDIDFLRSRYTRTGNVEMAAKLNERRRTFRIIDGRKVFRTFTERHVEKKMKLPGLRRTAEQIRQIKKRNPVITGKSYWTSSMLGITAGRVMKSGRCMRI